MVENPSRWLAVAVAILLVTPMGAVVAQEGNDTDESSEQEANANETATNETEANESEEDDEADDEAEEDAEASDEDEEADDDGADEEDDEATARSMRGDRGQHSEQSSWDVDNDTYTGERIQVTVDEELPGLRDVSYLDPENAVFATVELAGANLTYHAQHDTLAGETNESEFAIVDHRASLAIEAEDEAAITIAIADGVEVNESDSHGDDDDDEAVFELQLAENQTGWFYGEELSYANGTFTLHDDARLSPTFPPAEDREDRRAIEERHDHREAGSQWDRANGSFDGEFVSFQLDANDTRVTDYALKGSTIPVFAEIDLPSDEEAEWRAHGKVLELRTDDTRLRILDIPPAVVEVRGDENASSQIVLADGVEASLVQEESEDGDDDDEEHEDRLWRLNLTDNRTGWLAGEDVSLDNGTFTVSDKAMFRAVPTQANISENKGPGSMPDAAQERGDRDDDDDEDDEDRGPPAHAGAHDRVQLQQRIEHAKASGQVSAEVHIGNGSEPVSVEMGDVRVPKAWATTEGPAGAGMTIEAPDDTPGTTVTMTLDKDQIGNLSLADAGEKLAVDFDNETIEMADGLDDVLDASDDDQAEYLLLVGGEEIEVLVSVPHFSPHTIEVYETQSGEAVDENAAPGFGIVGVLAASALALAVATMRNEH